VGLRKLSWQTFFRVCTEEMDDLSQRAVKLVIEYCLEVLEEVEEKIRGKASLARLEAALNLQYAEQNENKATGNEHRMATSDSPGDFLAARRSVSDKRF